ncbi:MAG TPA: hypothetical protein EYQ14_28980 [Gammaproteobacteria bacterium]|nr:hypothetical protein [Gammaproteobacteria bacterium]HIL94473.1 hypothetical protein [Pseudomonadales bacterium]
MASYIMPTLVTGFSPFDGRNVNSSWVAASSLRDVATLRIPVVWGKPLELLQAAIAEFEPNIIISMGEGKEEYFHIETVARNKRNPRQDNNGQLPSTPIITGAPDTLQATIDSTALHHALKAEQIPVRISNDAGGFLCDETLYVLEMMKLQRPVVETVVFVHLPPFGTRLVYKGEQCTCDPAILSDFANCLLASVEELHSKKGVFS